MFTRKLKIEVVEGAERRPAPQAWLEDYFMKNFIRPAVFDETLVTGEGEMEAGFGVTPEIIREQLEQWWQGRKMIPPTAQVEVRER
jgi:hypothetical protein